MTYKLPEPNRQFFCTKCGSSECEGDIRQPHPPCAKCGYLGFAADIGYTADQMRQAYAAGREEAMKDPDLTIAYMSGFADGKKAGREAMRQECADHVFNMAQWDENNEQWVVLHRASTAIRNLK